MTEFRKAFLSVISAALGDKLPDVPEGFDYSAAYEIARQYQIVPLVYYGALKIPGFKESKIGQAFFFDTCRYLSVSERQMAELEGIYGAFENAGIDYMPFKGAVLKELYPKPEMRPMGDADILIQNDRYADIRNIIGGMGFEELPENDPVYNWDKNGILHLELHRSLFSEKNADFYGYFRTGWERAARQGDSHRYSMSAEDEFIYLFTHFAKHYRNGGIGIKHMVDFYVFLMYNTNMDKKYLESGLRQLHLYEFYLNVMHTLDVWFGGAQSDEMSEFITDKIFSSGTFGTADAANRAQVLRESENHSAFRRKRIVSVIFPDYRAMCTLYGFLKRMPVLLPVMWVVRWINVLLNKRGSIKRAYGRLRGISEKNVSEYQQELDYVGLDFKFKE